MDHIESLKRLLVSGLPISDEQHRKFEQQLLDEITRLRAAAGGEQGLRQMGGKNVTVKIIWKFPLAVTGEQPVQMPEGAKILDVQMQNGELMLWALVDPVATKEPRTIIIHGTGHTVGNVGDHIATFQMGPLVFHAFEAGAV